MHSDPRVALDAALALPKASAPSPFQPFPTIFPIILQTSLNGRCSSASSRRTSGVSLRTSQWPRSQTASPSADSSPTCPSPCAPRPPRPAPRRLVWPLPTPIPFARSFLSHRQVSLQLMAAVALIIVVGIESLMLVARASTIPTPLFLYRPRPLCALSFCAILFARRPFGLRANTRLFASSPCQFRHCRRRCPRRLALTSCLYLRRWYTALQCDSPPHAPRPIRMHT